MNQTKPSVSATAESTFTYATHTSLRDAPEDMQDEAAKRLRPVRDAASSGGSIEDAGSATAGLPSKEAVVGYGLEDSMEALTGDMTNFSINLKSTREAAFTHAGGRAAELRQAKQRGSALKRTLLHAPATPSSARSEKSN